MNPLITVVVPVYRVEEYLDECVQSLISQTYKNLEIILVDDGSPDNCPQICDDWAGRDSRIRLIHKPNGGLSSARNAGMDVAKGEYVYFVDSDDELPLNAIELLTDPLKIREVDIILGKYKVIGGGGKRGVPLYLSDGTYLKDEQILCSYAKGYWDVTACNKMYRMDFLKSNFLRFKEGLVHEDVLWSFQIACLARSVYIVARDTYIYKIRDNSIVTSESCKNRIETYSLIFSEICRCAADLNLMCDSNVHNIVENLRKTIVQMGKGEYGVEKSIYMDLRMMIDKSYVTCFRLNGIGLKRDIRDFHFALPPLCGFHYIYIMFRMHFYLKQCYMACCNFFLRFWLQNYR